MLSVKPFRGFLVRPDLAAEVTCPPYDVIDRSEAGRLAEGKPRSFLHIIRSEIDFPQSVNPYDTSVYSRAAENLKQSISDGTFVEESQPSVLVYRLTMNGHSQTGLVALFSVADYDEGRIKIHEKTRPDKEDDRVRHIQTTQAHAEPVFLAYRSDDALTSRLEAETSRQPFCDFTSSDNVRHTIWKVYDFDDLLNGFRSLSALYIADGHHRAKSASRVYSELSNSSNPSREGASHFLAVAFPHTQLNILAYNRIIYRPKVSPSDLLKQLTDVFEITKGASPVPHSAGEFRLYIDRTWFGLKPKAKPGIGSDPVSRLDVSVLFETVLKPIFGIQNERTDKNIDFVGGIRGTEELEKLVDNQTAVCAFSMYPVSVESVLDVADQGLIMAPKSTWFEPKLRSGFFFHRF